MFFLISQITIATSGLSELTDTTVDHNSAPGLFHTRFGYLTQEVVRRHMLTSCLRIHFPSSVRSSAGWPDTAVCTRSVIISSSAHKKNNHSIQGHQEVDTTCRAESPSPRGLPSPSSLLPAGSCTLLEIKLTARRRAGEGILNTDTSLLCVSHKPHVSWYRFKAYATSIRQHLFRKVI